MAGKKPGLSDRQKAQSRALYQIASDCGLWTKTTGPEGAHYVEGQHNPFKKEGVRCDVCIFFDDNRCDIVKGSIEPDAMCKLWVIPQSEL